MDGGIDRQKKGQKGEYVQKQKERLTDLHGADRWTDMQKEGQAKVERERETDGPTEYRQADKQTEGYTGWKFVG